jgi:TPR repeat protein
MGWIRRGLDLYLASKASSSAASSLFSSRQMELNPLTKSLLCYLYAGELGFEVAQSNAAYLLRTKLITASSSPGSTSSSSLTISHSSFTSSQLSVNSNQQEQWIMKQWYSNNQLLNRLLFNQNLLIGKLHLKMENIFFLGNCYFYSKCGLSSSSSTSSVVKMTENRRKAMYYYQLSSTGGNHVASAYLGMIYHFNLFEEDTSLKEKHVNLIRANRYYNGVLRSNDVNENKQQQSQQLYYFVRMLHSLLQWKSVSALSPLHWIIEGTAKWFWQ